ncbi:glycosyltransferase [Waterburya agarophytonicola K14]|uniref:Glycosyltransferase n=1 Tax=Waterburya agarophytonicola KI4 TaxID=2874699 RepID=A0A964BQV7_9CYAN|nr:glycosyltransferase [Waterburya agarophytonicola]MCC0176150.1 glycosyltransferase [Waterburya agarophytonicola KI4]
MTILNKRELGLVVIGRNEGDLLRQCLLSAIAVVPYIVYVDSGSTDNSVTMARSLGVEIVELDLSRPFTAGRARNEGFFYLTAQYPQIELVQFVDGDCEIVDGWLTTAQETLEAEPNIAIACGRRRERYPDKFIYNRLCDLEWDTPVGEIKACGGDFMVRVTAFQWVGGFNPTLIAGEEPELCIRLRQQHRQILRIDADMTLHDACMTTIGQWWQRAVRGGYAYAEGSWLYGKTAERHWVKESRSIWFWGLILPLLIVVLLLPTNNFSLLLLGLYPLVIYRVYQSLDRQIARKDAWSYAIHCILSKFPQIQGQIRFHWARLQGKRSNLIEYKSTIY